MTPQPQEARDSRGVHVPEGAGRLAAPGEGLPRTSSAATASRHRPLIIEHEPTGPILYEAGCRCGWKAPSLFLTDADAERAGWDHEDECEEAESNG